MRRKKVIWIVVAIVVTATVVFTDQPMSPAEALTDYSARGTRSVEDESARRRQMKIVAKPTKEQLAFQELELGLFIHFGLSTYTGESSGSGQEPALLFNPEKLNCDQWMDVAKSMGAKYVVLTARHEGGFCIWPTETTDYSIKSSPWKEGLGDVVREYVDAARRHGLAVGLYHSSWHDSRHMNFRDEEYFKKKRPEALEKFTHMQEQQVKELLTNYGPITYLWFDHHGCPGYGTDPFWRRIDQVVKQTQPACQIFGSDIWITGTHSGRAAYPCWYAVETQDGTRMTRPIGGKGTPWGEYYRAWEANTCASGHWFWDEKGVDPLESLVSKYYDSVGVGANFLINFAPNPDGLMPADVVQRAKEFGDTIRAHFDKPIAEISGQGEEFVLEFGEPAEIEHVVIMEQLANGQKIAKYRIDAMKNGAWKEIASGETVGHKRIHRIQEAKVEKLRFVCLDSLLKPIEIRSLSAY